MRVVLRWAREVGKTKRQLLSEITLEDLAEYIAFCHLEPAGDDWRQTATIAHAIYACTLGGKAPTVEQLMPIHVSEPEPDKDFDPMVALQLDFASRGFGLKGFCPSVN